MGSLSLTLSKGPTPCNMINSASVFIFIVFFILTRVYFHIKKPKKYVGRIPGPPVHPLFGNFLTLSSLDPVPYKTWHTLTQTFGPIVRLVMGPTTMVILGGLEEIKEAMNNELLDDRAISPTANLIRYGTETFEEISFFGRGIQPLQADVSPVERWRELRRFTLKSLRDLGFAKSCSEEAIIEECKVLLDNIRASVGGEEGEVDLEKSLNCAALNIVWNLVAGQRFLYDDPQMKEIVRVADFTKFMEAAIKEHEESLDENNPRDFIDMFLIQSKNDTRQIYTKKQLIR